MKGTHVRFHWLQRRVLSLALVSLAVILQAMPLVAAQPRPTAVGLPSLKLSPEVAKKVGHRVWRNETGGKPEAITAWNKTEAFASMGIGHFIWFSKDLDTRFSESFPNMMRFLRQRGAKLPAWLDKPRIPPSPWHTREAFFKDFYAPRMVELRRFLTTTVGLQTQYMVVRMQAALPKVLAAIPDAKTRRRAKAQFIRVVKGSPDLYPLIDYVNFKGEGISAKETFINAKTGKAEGWGLKHVLVNMRGSPRDIATALDAFADAARFVLLRRIRNNAASKRWQKGWIVRVNSYRRPL